MLCVINTIRRLRESSDALEIDLAAVGAALGCLTASAAPEADRSALVECL